MSHSVTVTRTTTTTTGSTTAIILNSGFLKTIPGILKVVETALGATVVGLLCSSHYHLFRESSYIYILLTSVAFLIGTGINLIACLLSFFTSSNLPRTMFELLYHAIAFFMYLAAGVAFIVYVNKTSPNDEPFMAAAIIALINSVLYLASTVFSYKSFLA